MCDLPICTPNVSRGNHNQVHWCHSTSLVPTGGPSMLPKHLFVSLVSLISSPPTLRPLPLHREASISSLFVGEAYTCASTPVLLCLFSGLSPSLASSPLSLTFCVHWLFSISICDNMNESGGHHAK